MSIWNPIVESDPTMLNVRSMIFPSETMGFWGWVPYRNLPPQANLSRNQYVVFDSSMETMRQCPSVPRELFGCGGGGGRGGVCMELDARIQPLYVECTELNVPVMIFVSETMGFWKWVPYRDLLPQPNLGSDLYVVLDSSKETVK